LNTFVICKKYTCPKATECFRLRASPDEGQLSNTFPGLCNEIDNYRLFIKIRPEDKIIELEELPKNESL